MIISRTPFRISFFGGGSDYPQHFLKHGGAVLGTTIDKYCYITCRYLPPFFEHRYSVAYSKIENVKTIDEIEHPSAREVLRFMQMEGRGISIRHDGDLPARSGMGSSSAFTVGLLNALHTLKGSWSEASRLADSAMYIEQDKLKETVGCQDQILTAYGGLNHIAFSSSSLGYNVTPVRLESERLQELESHLMLVYTGIARTSSDIASQYYDRDNEYRLAELVAIGHEAINGIQNLNKDISFFGRLLHVGWNNKRALGPTVTNDYIDDIYWGAQEAGAIGGKLLGAGGGGFMLLFAKPEDQPRIRERLNKLIHVPFKFEDKGSQIILREAENDYSSADRDRQGQEVAAFREGSDGK